MGNVLMSVKTRLKRLWFEKNAGASAIEYVLVIALVAAGIIIGAQLLGSKTSNVLSSASSALSDSSEGNGGGAGGGKGSGGSGKGHGGGHGAGQGGGHGAGQGGGN